MVKITVLAVGKIKEKFLTEAIGEYAKRLKRFCSLEITEVADEKAPETLSGAERDAVLEKEGARLLSRLKKGSTVIALDVDGKPMNSEEFAGTLSELMVLGKSDIAFIIGGSLGLSEEILKAADIRLSLSKMTFPHNLARLIILEQIYRAFKIISGETYHK